MSWTTDVTTGLAEFLQAEGLGTWRPTGVYAANETAIVIGVLPSSPDRAIAITAYRVAESTHLSDVIEGFQIRCRGTADMRVVNDMADNIRSALHGRRGLTFGPARIPLIWRQSHTVMGADSNRRHETSSNYYAPTGQPTTLVND